MEILRRIARHLDPRVPFTKSYNTTVQFAYIGIITQSLLLVYLSIHLISAGVGGRGLTVLFNLISAVVLPDIGVSFLRGRRQSQIAAGVFCALQALYYFGLTQTGDATRIIPSMVVYFGFFSCLATLRFLFSKSTKNYLSNFEDRFFN